LEFFKNVTDIMLSYDTDLDFENGDLKLCNGTDCIKRKVFALLVTEEKDWKIHPEEGASPVRFAGMHNTKTTAKLIEEFLINKLQIHVLPATVAAKVVPIDRESVKCYIDLIIGDVEIANIPLTIDFANGFIYPQIDEEVDTIVSSQNLKENNSSSLQTPNPFWDRLSKQ